MKKGATKPNSKWGVCLGMAVELEVSHGFLLEGDSCVANQFRSMLRVSNRTMRWRFTVKHAKGNWYAVTKMGEWRAA